MADQLSSQLESLRIRREPAKAVSWPRHTRLVAGLLLGVLALAAGGSIAWHQLGAGVMAEEVRLTQVQQLSQEQGTVQLTVTGYVVPTRFSRVAARITGRVAQVHVQQGQRVEAGQALLSLDSLQAKAQLAVRQAQAKAAAARAQSAHSSVATLEAELLEGRQQSDRAQRLARAGVSASGTAEDLAAQVVSRRHRVRGARADAAAAAAEAEVRNWEVKSLEADLGEFELRSPITGTVVTNPPQAGEILSPPQWGGYDRSIIEIVDLDSLMIDVDVPEPRLHDLEPGAPAQIILDAFPSEAFAGKVASITPDVDRAKATVVVRVSLDEPKRGALPDMAARVSFLSRSSGEASARPQPKSVIPKDAVVERAGGQAVLTVEGEVARWVPVKLGPSVGSGFEVISGPRAGTRLVVSPPKDFEDGKRVKEQTAP